VPSSCDATTICNTSGGYGIVAMTPSTLASEIRRVVVERNAALYWGIFTSTKPDQSSDAHWKRALVLYQSLDAIDQATFRAVIRQTIVDTVSSLLAVLDGASKLDGVPEELVLSTKSGDQILNGYLQDLFLEAEEAAERRK
jgi:hypothetical protein